MGAVGRRSLGVSYAAKQGLRERSVVPRVMQSSVRARLRTLTCVEQLSGAWG